MPPMSSLVLSLGAMRKRDWMVREVMKKIVCGSKCRTGYAMAPATEQVGRQMAATADSCIPCEGPSHLGTPLMEHRSRIATAGNRVRSTRGELKYPGEVREVK